MRESLSSPVARLGSHDFVIRLINGFTSADILELKNRSDLGRSGFIVDVSSRAIAPTDLTESRV